MADNKDLISQYKKWKQNNGSQKTQSFQDSETLAGEYALWKEKTLGVPVSDQAYIQPKAQQQTVQSQAVDRLTAINRALGKQALEATDPLFGTADMTQQFAQNAWTNATPEKRAAITKDIAIKAQAHAAAQTKQSRYEKQYANSDYRTREDALKALEQQLRDNPSTQAADEYAALARRHAMSTPLEAAEYRAEEDSARMQRISAAKPYDETYTKAFRELQDNYATGEYFALTSERDSLIYQGEWQKAEAVNKQIDDWMSGVTDARELELLNTVESYERNYNGVAEDKARHDYYMKNVQPTDLAIGQLYNTENLDRSASAAPLTNSYTMALRAAGMNASGDATADAEAFSKAVEDKTISAKETTDALIAKYPQYADVINDVLNHDLYGADRAKIDDPSSYRYFLSEDEWMVFYALLGKGTDSDTSAAFRFLKSLKNDLASRAQQDFQNKISSAIDAAPPVLDVLLGTAATAGGLVADIVGGPLAFADMLIQGSNPNYDANGVPHYDYDPYTGAAAFNTLGQGLKGGVSENIEQNWGTVPAFLYDVVYSTAQSLAGAVSMGTAYTFIMGSSAAASRAKELYARGASANEIFAGAIAAGINEALFEYVSLDKLVNPDTSKSLLRRILTQAGVEGSEEIATDIANRLADAGRMSSDINYQIQTLLEQNPGMTYAEAQRQAEREFVEDVVKSGLAGFLSGGLSASGYDISNEVRRRNGLRSIGSDVSSNYSTEAVINEGLTAGEGTVAGRIAAEIQQKVKNGEKVSNKEIGELTLALDRSNVSKTSAAEQRLQDLAAQVVDAQTAEETLLKRGASAEEAQSLAEDLAKYARGEEISSEAEEALNKSGAAGGFMMEAQNAQNEYETAKAKTLGLRYAATTRGTGSTKANEHLRNSRLDAVHETALKNPLKKATLAKSEIDAANKLNKYAVSETGETTYNGEKIENYKAAYDDSGNIGIKLASGEVVSPANVQFSTQDEAVLWEKLSEIKGITPTAFNTLISMYNAQKENVSAGVWARGVREGYEIGSQNLLGTKAFPKAEAKARYLSNISNEARGESERQGRYDVRRNQQRASKTVERSEANVKKGETQKEQLKRATDTLDKLGRKYRVEKNILGDGYLDSDGTIVLNENAVDPEAFVMKHELTHFGETSEYYKDFVNAVKSSKLFAEWIDKQVVKEGTTAQQEAAYIREIQDRYQRYNVTLSNTAAHQEMIANFVGDVLFTENGAGLEGLVSNMSADNRSKVLKFIDSIIQYFKRKFGNRSAEAMRLEEMFAKVQQTATAERGKKSYDIGNTVEQKISSAKTSNVNEKGEVTPSSTQIRVANGLQAEYQTGNHLATERGEVNYSISDNDDYMDAALRRARSKNYGFINDLLEAQKVRKVIAERLKQDDIVNMLPPDETTKVWQTKSEKGKNTFVDDSAYGGSEESSTECVRTLLTDELVNIVAEKLGRQPTVKEQIKLAQFMLEIASTPECVYCYVAMDRKAFRNYLNSYVEQTDGIIANYKAGMSDEENYEAFRGNRADTAKMRKRFSLVLDSYKQGVSVTAKDLVGAVNSSEYMYNLKHNDDISAQKKKLIEDAIVYAQSASWAKKRRPYLAYNGHILKWSDAKIDALNKKYGLRFYSFSDYSPAFILENMQMMTDAAVRGLKGLAYTKEIDFARIFAPTGIGINISCFGSITDGKVVEDKVQGAAWEEAQALRKKHPNVGITFVATNNQLIEWALAQEWIDVVIPFHLVRTGAKAAQYLGYTNYTHVSSDTKNAAWRDTSYKTIYPEQHHNDKETFLRLCRENGLNPRFEAWVDNPNYMKLVNETRQSTDESKPLRAIFDQQAALDSLANFVKEGGYYKHLGGDVKSLEAYADQAYESLKATEDENKEFSIPDISDEELMNEWVEKGKEYGVFPEGEMNTTGIRTPRQINDKTRVERAVNTILGDSSLSDEFIYEMGKETLLGKTSYEPESDQYAKDYIQNASQGELEERVKQMLGNKDKQPGKLDVASAAYLIKQAVADGDVKKALDLSTDLAAMLTRAGQSIQAWKLFKRMTPYGKLITLQKTVDMVNAEVRPGGQKAHIDEDMAAVLLNAETEEEQQQAAENIKKDVAQQLDASWLEKWHAWRYMSMLINPRTHIRNIVGNAVFVPAVYMKDFTAAAFERIPMFKNALNGDRRHVFHVSKEYRDLAKAICEDETVQRQLTGSWGDYKDEIQRKKRIFKNRPMEWGRTKAMGALEKEDFWFKNIHYRHALASYLQAQKVDAKSISTDVFKNGEMIKGKNAAINTLMKAHEYAVEQAYKNTYNDANAFANIVNDIGRKSKVAKFLVDSVIPFRRTPANIIKRGVEYSPIGLMSAISKGAYQAAQTRLMKQRYENGKISKADYNAFMEKKGFNGAEFINNLAAGATGTIAFFLGMLLRSMGVLTGRARDDEDKYLKNRGLMQEYAANLFGSSYTIDWLAPLNMPLFMGVEFLDQLNEGRDGDPIGPSTFTKPMSQFLQPIINLSMLEGVQNAIDAVSYSEKGEELGDFVNAIGASYFSQSMPTLLGNFSKIFDSKKRMSYTSTHASMDRFMQQMWNTFRSKVIGAQAMGKTMERPPQIDVWGRDVESGGWVQRAFDNLISPGSWKNTSYEDVDNEVLSVYKNAEEKSGVLPTKPDKYIDLPGGQRMYLDEWQYYEYCFEKGSASYTYIAEALNNKDYMSLDADQKAEVIRKLYSYANARAKTLASNNEYDYSTNSTYKTAYKYVKGGGNIVEFYVNKVKEK